MMIKGYFYLFLHKPMSWVLIRIASPLQSSLQPIVIVQVLHFVCFNCFSLILFSIFLFLHIYMYIYLQK